MHLLLLIITFFWWDKNHSSPSRQNAKISFPSQNCSSLGNWKFRFPPARTKQIFSSLGWNHYENSTFSHISARTCISKCAEGSSLLFLKLEFPILPALKTILGSSKSPPPSIELIHTFFIRELRLRFHENIFQKWRKRSFWWCQCIPNESQDRDNHFKHMK